MKAFIEINVFRSIWIISVIVGFNAGSDYAHAQHEIFDESVIQKWKNYEDFSHGLQGTARVQRSGNGKPLEYIGRFKQNRECALIIEPYNQDPSFSSYTMINPHYTAIINVSNSDPSHAVLRKYTPLPEGTETLSPFDAVYIHTSRHFNYGGTIRLRQVVLDPSFKVTRIAREVEDGRELVRVEHIYNHVRHVASKDIHERRRGSLWLDPSRCWCIRRSKVSTEFTTRGERSSETERELVFETIDHSSGFPILKSITENSKMFNYKNQQKSQVTKKTDYELEVNDSVPNSEFTLAAFGLPEPGSDPVKKPIPIYVWILVAAGVCAALALGFRYLAQRRARAEPTA